MIMSIKFIKFIATLTILIAAQITLHAAQAAPIGRVNGAANAPLESTTADDADAHSPSALRVTPTASAPHGAHE